MLKNKLLQKIKANGMSTRQAAESIGVSHTTIIRALRGEAVDVATILKISEWLEVKPSTLINSMSPTKSGLPEQIMLMLAGSPILAKEFEKAINSIVEGTVDETVIADIAAYASYRVNLGRLHS